MPVSYLVTLLSALLVTALLVPLARGLALRTDFVDHPGEAKFHTDPTPYLGGVALAGAVLLSLVAGVQFVPRLSVLVLAAVALAAIGLVDDRRHLSAWVRLVAQVAAAVAMIGVGVVARVTGHAVINDALTIGWVVVVTNAFNLLDNMDGLAAGVGASSALAIAVLAATHTQFVVGPMAVAVLGGCLGFLLYNWAPAAIFLGDAGSLFLGFLLSVLAIAVRTSVSMPGGLVVTALIVAIPLLDTLIVVVARLGHHRSIFLGGRDHLSHRLVTRGAEPSTAVALLVFAQLVLSADAIAVGSGRLGALAGSAFGLGLVGIVAALAAPVRVYDSTVVPRRLAMVLGAGLVAAASLVVGASSPSGSAGASDPGLAGPLRSPGIVLVALGVGLVAIAAITYLGFGRDRRVRDELAASERASGREGSWALTD